MFLLGALRNQAPCFQQIFVLPVLDSKFFKENLPYWEGPWERRLQTTSYLFFFLQMFPFVYSPSCHISYPLSKVLGFIANTSTSLML